MLTTHPATLPDGRVPVLLSAHAEELVQAEAAGLERYLHSQTGPVSVPAVAQQLLRTRAVRRHRAVIRAHDSAELIAGLQAIRHGAEHPLVCQSDRRHAARTAFVFPGQGNQWPGMGAELLDTAAYRGEADRCAKVFHRLGCRSPLAYLRGLPGSDADPVLVQAAQFTHAAALAATWRHWGVLPDVTVGHSLGELAAAYTAGAIDLAVAAAVVVTRAELTDSSPGRFGMAMLGIGVNAATALIGELAGWLELSVVNGPESVVVAGDLDAVRGAVRHAGARGIFARELPVGYPAHTSALTPLRERLLEQLPESEFRSAPVEFIGSVRGGPVPPGTNFGQYWYDNLRNPVRFDRAAAAAVARGATTFIEMSAHPTLLAALADTAGVDQLLGSTARDRPAAPVLAANIAAAAVADPGYRWRDFVPAGVGAPSGQLRHFPHAPMRAIALWAGAEPPTAEHTREPTTMAECWLPAGADPQTPPTSVAVVDYSGKAAGLTARLAAALRADALLTEVDAEQAELLILVAPTGVGGPDRADADIVTATAAFAVDATTQTAVLPGERCRRVWLVTSGAEQIGTDPLPRALPAALAALHRGTGFGYPDQTFAQLDLAADPTAADLRSAGSALRLTDTEVAVRAGEILVRRLRRCAPAPFAGSVPDTVLITGGTGAIGLTYAAFCAEHGARDITLLSRSGADGATGEVLDAISGRTGARIAAIRCDLTDAEAVREAAARTPTAPAGLIVHAASAPAVAGADITATAVRQAFGAKVIGLDILLRDWPLRRDARVLVCSSVLALWGGSGYGLYAAANRMADVLAVRLRAQGLAASSIRWGLWQTVAVVTGTEKDRIARTGLTPMPPDEAIAAGLAAPHTDPVILAADWERLAVFFTSRGVRSPFAPAVGPVRTAAGSAPAPVISRPLPEAVAEELAAVLGIDGPGNVDMHRAMIDLGLDSLLALDLRKRLIRITGRKVPLARLLTGISGTELVAALAAGQVDRFATGLDPGKDAVPHD